MVGSVERGELEAVARATFGTGARIESARELTPVLENGVVRRAGGSRSLAYAVKLVGAAGRFVFRFHRGFWEDRYEYEAGCYDLLARHTGVGVPRIHAIDRSRRIVPTPYVVMDYLEGESWRYLTHPRNPAVPESEKEEIRRRTGLFYAQVHGIRRPVGPGEQEATRLRYMFERLESAVRAGHLPVPPRKVERCLRALDAEPRFRNEVASFCLADTEIFFRREAGGWELAFVLDPEWMEYRDRYSDLVFALPRAEELWELNEPLAPDARELSRDPFFRGYQELHPTDPELFVRLAPYYHLGLWGNLLGEEGQPEKKEWIRIAKGELILDLIHRVGRRAGRSAPSPAR